MTPLELKRLYETKNPEGHFFARSSMKYFGDTMANYGVQSFWYPKRGLFVYRLYRKRSVKNGLNTAHLFSREGDHLGTE